MPKYRNVKGRKEEATSCTRQGDDTDLADGHDSDVLIECAGCWKRVTTDHKLCSVMDVGFGTILTVNKLRMRCTNSFVNSRKKSPSVGIAGNVLLHTRNCSKQ